MSYLDKLYKPICENTDNLFTVGKFTPNGEFKVYESVNNFIEMLDVYENVSKTENPMIIMQSVMDSLNYNNVIWFDNSEIETEQFKLFHWPDMIMTERKGICQDFAVMHFIVCNKLNIECNLVFIMYVNASTGDRLSGHTYSIFKFQKAYWFWNYNGFRMSAIHGPFFSFKNAFDFSVDYYNIIFNTLNIHDISNTDKFDSKCTILLKTYVTHTDMMKVLEKYNEKITRNKLWNSVPPTYELGKQISELETRISNKSIVIAKPFENVDYSIPCSGTKLYFAAKKLGKIKYLYRSKG